MIYLKFQRLTTEAQSCATFGDDVRGWVECLNDQLCAHAFRETCFLVAHGSGFRMAKDPRLPNTVFLQRYQPEYRHHH